MNMRVNSMVPTHCSVLVTLPYALPGLRSGLELGLGSGSGSVPSWGESEDDEYA